jgi:WD40 repeat protein/tetratricopeptide (TPR) repeat protein
MVDEHYLDIVTYNKNALNNLRRAIVLGQGQFSLILARVNYRQLRRSLLQELSSHLRLTIVQLPASATSLRADILAQLQPSAADEEVATQALMITGLPEVRSLDQLLKAANLGRDELPKTFNQPVVLWVNDTALQQLNRYAPDLKSFAATPIRFEYPIQSLISALTAQANSTFTQILDTDLGGSLSFAPGPLAAPELSCALSQLESQEQAVTNDLLADLLFLEGRNLHQKGDLARAFGYYENSLMHWQSLARSGSSASGHSLTELDKQAVLLFHLGLWWCSQALNSGQTAHPTAYQTAQEHFETCLAIFRRQNRPDRVGRFISALAEVLQKQARWAELKAVAQEGLHLHRSDLARLARDYGYLAEVAIARAQCESASESASAAHSNAHATPLSNSLSEAQGFAQQALETFDKAESAAAHDRGRYLYLLAIAQQLQGQFAEAIAQLEKARAMASPHAELALHRQILERLWHLYFDHKHYAKAFEIKLAQRRVESLFGLRAFIGASQIQPAQPRASGLADTAFADTAFADTDHRTEEKLAAEIKASGRTPDIDAIASRLSQPRYPLVVIHGQSGVGKSSTISAGLLPRLHSMTSEGRTTLPVLIDSYGDWERQIILALSGPVEAADRPDEAADGAPSIAEIAETASLLTHQLQALTSHTYQQIVLIFDQFEDFFYEYPAIEQRRSLYTFLRDALELPYVKIVLSLREDFLHYLLEWDRSADLAVIDNDILSKEIRYYIGNFTPRAAEMVIRQLTQTAGFELEEGLITALVDDLAADAGEVRPIELQVVGAQLQREQITTLAQYQQLGHSLENSPKTQLLKNFLNNVLHDCGPENGSLAQSVLYLLSEGTSRPLKSYSELAEALSLPLSEQQLPLVLNILVGSGLIFEVPEVSGVRYQLVHEYLASLIQQQPANLVEALQTERHRRQLTEDQLQKALAAQSDSLAQTTLARQKTKLAEIRALVSVARSLQLSGDGLEALSKAMRAAKQLHSSPADPLLTLQTALCLATSLREIREKNELTGHRNWVLAVDCSRSATAQQKTAQKIVSASDDGTLKLWNSRGQLIRTLSGHHAGVLDVRLSPDGQYIASASLDHSIFLWRANGDFLQTFDSPASVTSLSFSPVAPLLAATYSDAKVRLWSLTGELVRTLEGHEDWARSVAFSPDGQTLATGSEDQTVRLWTVGGELLHTLQGQQGWVRSVAFSPDGQTLISAGDANSLRLWSTDGRKLKTFYGHQDWVRSAAFSPDGQHIASASDDQTIKIWRLDGTVQQTFNQRSSVHSVAWSADGQSVVSGGDDGQVHIWQLEGPPEPICRGHAGIVWSARWHPQGKQLLSAGGDDKITLWSELGDRLNAFGGHQRGVHSIEWSKNGEFFASASADHSVRIWSAAGELITTLLGHEAAVWRVSYSPDGSQLASVSSDRTLRLWSTQGERQQTWYDHTDTVWHVSFSPDGQYLITASEDHTLRLWHRQTGLVQTLKGHDGGIWCAVFSPDGQWVASGGADGIIRLWSLNWQAHPPRIEPNPTPLRGHRDWVRSLCFNPNSTFLASASDDGTVRLWSLLEMHSALSSSASESAAEAVSQLLPPLTGHEGVVWDVDFDAKGERLVSASADGTVRIWDLRLNALLEKGCDWLADWLIARPELARQLCDSADQADQLEA